MFSVHIRFDILDQEMKTLMTQIDGVNLAANNLVESGHPRSGEVKQYQDRLNKRWGVGRAVAARGRVLCLGRGWADGCLCTCDERAILSVQTVSKSRGSLPYFPRHSWTWEIAF